MKELFKVLGIAGWPFLTLIANILTIIGFIWCCCVGAWKVVLFCLLFILLQEYIWTILLILFGLPIYPYVNKIENSKFYQRLSLIQIGIIVLFLVPIYNLLLLHFFYFKFVGTISILPLSFITYSLLQCIWSGIVKHNRDEQTTIFAFLESLICFVVMLLLIFTNPSFVLLFWTMFFGQCCVLIFVLRLYKSDIIEMITNNSQGLIKTKRLRQKKKIDKDIFYQIFSVLITVLFVVFISFCVVKFVKYADNVRENRLFHISF